jgi:hypothetical protein
VSGEDLFRNIAHRKKRAFLAAYSELGTVTHAADAAGIDRRSHSNWMHSDPGYRDAFESAGEMAVQHLEREARRRAIEGTEKPVYQGGKLVGTIREYSDTLLIFLLKGARPERYRERVDLTVDMRREAERFAAEMGLDPIEVLAEAEAIVRGRQ